MPPLPDPRLLPAAPHPLLEPWRLTRLAMGGIYFLFGLLKLYPDLSTAEMLASQTVLRLRLGLGVHTALTLVAVFELTIAVLLLLGVSMRYVFPLFLLHMAGTLLPLFLLPELTFKFVPFAPTLEGQYILKNAVIVSAGWWLYLAERQQRALVADPTPGGPP